MTKNEIIQKLEHINCILHVESRDELAKLCPYAKTVLKNPEVIISAVIAGCAAAELKGLLKEIENGF